MNDLNSSPKGDPHRVAEGAGASGHTPGPWEVAPEVSGSGAQWRWVGPVGWKTRVCRVVLYDGEEAEQEANARLIAAAPELLDAAAYAVERFGMWKAQTTAQEDALDRLRAAISKATGQAAQVAAEQVGG